MQKFKTVSRYLGVLGLLHAGSAIAQAGDKACYLQGDFTMAGQRVVINDCAENLTMPAAQFREACEWMANPFEDANYKATISYLLACPAAPQAKCQNVMMGQMSFYYYSRDAELLAHSKTSCEGFSGQWVQ